MNGSEVEMGEVVCEYEIRVGWKASDLVLWTKKEKTGVVITFKFAFEMFFSTT